MQETVPEPLRSLCGVSEASLFLYVKKKMIQTQKKSCSNISVNSRSTFYFAAVNLNESFPLSSRPADTSPPQPPPVSQGAARGADPGRLTEPTRTAAPTLRPPPHIGATGRWSPELPAHKKTVTTDRRTMCPSESPESIFINKYRIF